MGTKKIHVRKRLINSIHLVTAFPNDSFRISPEENQKSDEQIKEGTELTTIQLNGGHGGSALTVIGPLEYFKKLLSE